MVSLIHQNLTISAAAQQMLTLAADRFTEEEFNLGPFSFPKINIFIDLP